MVSADRFIMHLDGIFIKNIIVPNIYGLSQNGLRLRRAEQMLDFLDVGGFAPSGNISASAHDCVRSIKY